MKIRKAKKIDAPIILRLTEKLINYHKKIDKGNKSSKQMKMYFKREIEHQIGIKNNFYIVAEDKSVIVGYLSGDIRNGSPTRIYKKVGYIGNMFVEEKYRKKGIGENLMKEFIKECKKRKIKHFELSVNAQNKVAIGVWKKLGFVGYEIAMEKNLR